MNSEIIRRVKDRTGETIRIFRNEWADDQWVLYWIWNNKAYQLKFEGISNFEKVLIRAGVTEICKMINEAKEIR